MPLASGLVIQIVRYKETYFIYFSFTLNNLNEKLYLLFNLLICVHTYHMYMYI